MLTTGVADVQLDILDPTEHEDQKEGVSRLRRLREEPR